ncbi:unnamed protein product [Gongylonema pulchrum]|uniref:BRCT domain-containing protein n=1 Tax=Gongylonema pulchrum TaxID=637853 RepID=A0A183CWZ6_9BILA|nr:unnamed protein product [Gongylonema pulchrum]
MFEAETSSKAGNSPKEAGKHIVIPVSENYFGPLKPVVIVVRLLWSKNICKVVAESALFRDRVEIECPYLPGDKFMKFKGESAPQNTAVAGSSERTQIGSKTRIILQKPRYNNSRDSVENAAQKQPNTFKKSVNIEAENRSAVRERFLLDPSVSAKDGTETENTVHGQPSNDHVESGKMGTETEVALQEQPRANSVKNRVAPIMGNEKTKKKGHSVGWKRLAEICVQENDGNSCLVENMKTGKQLSLHENSEVNQSDVQKISHYGHVDDLSQVITSSATEKKSREGNEVSAVIFCDANNGETAVGSSVTSHQKDQHVDLTNETNSFLRNSSSVEREIDQLFGDSGGEHSDDSHRGDASMKCSNDGDSQAVRGAALASSSEKGKNFEEKQTESDSDFMSGESSSMKPTDDRRMARQNNLETVLATDKKMRKEQKRKVATGSFDEFISGVSSKSPALRKERIEVPAADSSKRETERLGTASVPRNSPLRGASEDIKKRGKYIKLEEFKDSAHACIDKRKQKEFLMRREREEIERQKREQEEKERRRATEREKRREEEEQREARERSERERKRKEREDRERLKKLKNENVVQDGITKKYQERSGKDDNRIQKDMKKGISQNKSRNDEQSAKMSILDELFGDSGGPSTRAEFVRSEDYRQSRSSSVQKTVTKARPTKEEHCTKREKAEQSGTYLRKSSSVKHTGNSKESVDRPDSLNEFHSYITAKPRVQYTSILQREESSSLLETNVNRKIVVSGVHKGRENLLVGGGHSARVGMVLERATRVRTKYDHDQKLKQEYRKSEDTCSITASASVFFPWIAFWRTTG